MSTRNGRQPDYDEMMRREAAENEAANAQAQAQTAAQQHADGPLIDLLSEQAVELLDRLTDTDIESLEFEEIEAMLKPYLSQTQMLASHGDDYYDDLSHELLNENLAERVLSHRKRGRFLTGPFLQVAQEVEGDYTGIIRRPLSEIQREGLRTALVDVRTDRQSLGDGTFFDGITEIHVSSEVHRDDGDGSKSGGGFLSAINPFN